MGSGGHCREKAVDWTGKERALRIMGCSFYQPEAGTPGRRCQLPKGPLPQLERATRWVWERLLSVLGPAPFFWGLERAANGKWAPPPLGPMGAALPCSRGEFRGQ